MSAGPARILGIATALPAYEFGQAEAARLALGLLPPGDARLSRMLARIYGRSGIERRRSVLPDFGAGPGNRLLFPDSPDLRPEPSTARRNAVYAASSPGLALEAVTKLLGASGAPGSEAARVTHLVTASCTGFSAPGWDYELLRALPLAPSTARFNIGFMGCFAAFPALRLADHIARSEPGARVLVVALELCSLHYAIDASSEALVANALFADGCAAALVSAGEGESGGEDRVGPGGGGKGRLPSPRLRLGPFTSRVIPGTADEMAWTIGETGFSMRLSPAVARSLGAEAPAFVDGLLGRGLPGRGGLGRGDVRHWAVHPGGRAILDAFEDSLGLGAESLMTSRGVLRDHGNMSSPTVLFVLERLLREGIPGPVLASAFGPGLTAEACLMELEA